ncbi:MAG: lamin tail domain-containing protein [Candidatus Altiarchaeota archaeon]|nr:lamin tail domain-containing protein [Candidatus Altiarchaeota archaeon]
MLDSVTTFVKASKLVLIVFTLAFITFLLLFIYINPGNTQPKLNEILLNPREAGWEDQYVEIYNPGDQTVYLNGWTLESAKSVLPLFGEIKPKQYSVYFGEINAFDGKITLKNNLGYTVDSFSFDPKNMGFSAGRVPDGSGQWLWTTTPTPGSSNNVSEEAGV